MLNSQEKIKYLKSLVDKSIYVTKEDSNDPEFEKWKNLVERIFIKVFGEDSVELKQFNKLLFYYPVDIMDTSESDYIANHLNAFRRDFKILKDSIEQYIGEFLEEVDDNESKESRKIITNNKIFISHASADLPIVEEIIELLESIGLTSTQIFCTSFEGYGINLGDDFLKTLKDELEGNTLVIFILSKRFYESPVCLCEMGAAWVLSKSHIPILIPPMEYSEVRGVIPNTQGMKITEPLRFNLLKEQIEELFNIERKLNQSSWERKRDRAIDRVKLEISKTRA